VRVCRRHDDEDKERSAAELDAEGFTRVRVALDLVSAAVDLQRSI
jgi:hypothetical protein